MLADSNFLTALEHNAVSPTGQQMCIYGDLAYPLRVNLMAPFRGAALTAQMEALMMMMILCRMCVRQSSGCLETLSSISSLWTLKKTLK